MEKANQEERSSVEPKSLQVEHQAVPVKLAQLRVPIGTRPESVDDPGVATSGRGQSGLRPICS